MIEVRVRYAWITVTACLAAAGCGSTHAQPLNLEAARRLVSAFSQARSLGKIDLSGLEFAREVDIGQGLRVIVVSGSRSGGVAAFRGDGSMLTTIPTGQLTWIQLFDLDEDGVSEVIVEEIEGKGTGVLLKSFVLYVAGGETFREAWRQPSYRRESPRNPTATAPSPVEVRNFLRFDRSGAGRRPRMTYLLGPQDGCAFRERVFELSNRTVHQSPIDRDQHSGSTACR